jgi:hypothetical protein
MCMIEALHNLLIAHVKMEHPLQKFHIKVHL